MKIYTSNPKYGHPKVGQRGAGRARLADWTDPDFRADLATVMETYGRVRSRDTTMTTGTLTSNRRRKELTRTMSLLVENVRGIRTLSQLKPHLMEKIVQLWLAEGLSERTQINYFTTLRWFWQMHGISVRSIKDYVLDPSAYVVKTAAQFDRSVSAQISPDQVFKALEELDPRMRIYAQLAHGAGLRKQECLCLDPHADDLGGQLQIVRGAKGGRSRVVDLHANGPKRYAQARAALDELKQITPVGQHAGWPNLTLQQGLRRFEYLAGKAGITKKGIGVTFHGFRHDYAIDALERHTGHTAPVRGGMIIDYHRVREHQLLVSRQLGHNRAKVTTAYFGSFAAMRKRAQANFLRSWVQLEPHLAAARSHLQAYDIDTAYFVGARAMGHEVAAVEPFQLQLPYGIDAGIAAAACRSLTDLLTEAMKVAVVVMPDAVENLAVREAMMERAFPLFTPAGEDSAPRVPGPRPIEHGLRPAPKDWSAAP